VIGFDADDTLWVNEPYYREAEDQFIQLVSSYGVNGNIAAALFETEIANLRLYGYGIKAFMLSLVECAIELTEGGVSSRDINRPCSSATSSHCISSTRSNCFMVIPFRFRYG